MLENRLDKAMIKYNEAQSIKKTYEQIIKLLQEERVRFDNQLHAFEKTLKAKKQDVLELEVMSRDANHAKDVAKAELAKFEAQVNEERKQREKEIQELKELIKQKRQTDDKADKKVGASHGAAISLLTLPSFSLLTFAIPSPTFLPYHTTPHHITPHRTTPHTTHSK